MVTRSLKAVLLKYYYCKIWPRFVHIYVCLDINSLLWLQGYGTFYYTDDDYYEGEWFANNRCGWGRMYYTDGSIYEGEWYADKTEGHGMLRLANDNRYEGEWKDGKKSGRGKYYYLDNGQLFEGVWVDNIPKCGEMRDFDRKSAPEPTPFPVPKLEMVNPEEVLGEAEKLYLSDDDE